MEFVKLWSLISICFLLTLGTQAQAGSSNFELACLSWDKVVSEYNMEMKRDQVDQLKASHASIRHMIVNSKSLINSANESGDSNREIYICSVLEAASAGFNNVCLNDAGENIITEEIKDYCLSLHL